MCKDKGLLGARISRLGWYVDPDNDCYPSASEHWCDDSVDGDLDDPIDMRDSYCCDSDKM
ncbi:MAG: hypothetical protein GF349_04345 [Candidatus Magasanikbacteria bacterium]|nr:hypothetical protein [Candidatus Magasanikbacteria bacterium]